MESRRTYRSPRRADGAAATRAAIMRAAEDLFRTEGYAAATVAKIAQSSRVAVQTVYSGTGGKADILRELLMPAVRDPGVEQTMRLIACAPDGHQVIDALAEGTRGAHERHWPTLSALVPQCQAEPAAAAVLEAANKEYVAALTAPAERLQEMGALRADVDLPRAVDLLWFYLGQDAWFSLVGHRKWSFDAAQRWLAESAKHALLAQPAPAHP